METWEQITRHHLEETSVVHLAVRDACLSTIGAAASMLISAFRQGNKLLLCGNGGSAADCQHMAAEFTSRLSKDFVRPGLPAIALTTDTSFLTAFSNDIGFEGVFARQIQALGQGGDVLLAISTSGKSRNVILAMEEARRIGIRTIALCGKDGVASTTADVIISVPSSNTQCVQENHLAIEHILCRIVEEAIFGQRVN